MEWQHPQWLYLILPLGAAWLATTLVGRGRRRRAAEAFVATAMWSRILPAESRRRFWFKTLLRETALVAGLVALAGPRFGTEYEEVIPRGSDLYVLIDVSRSMLAGDVPPTRLGRAKADVASLVNRLEGERVGLIAFAGQAVVKCPLTVDYDAFRRSLDELDTASAPRGGTAIGDAIRKALEVFHARAERDQAIVLITDGDDQQSYPLEAAAVAAERQVTIFTVGLGDADQGARVPQSASGSAYLEYQGQQVWSKLDGSLLKEIALATSGVYVPVGTRAYDLGELYADHLQGRRGGDGGNQKRIRRSERFQVFLALALAALLADLGTRRYRPAANSPLSGSAPGTRAKTTGQTTSANAAAPMASALVLIGCLAAAVSADEPKGESQAGKAERQPEKAVREGLRLYANDEFDKAREQFAAAAEELGKDHAEATAVVAFDEACACHRNGDFERARELYLKAGLARDRRLAAAAHFNLGTLSAEDARRLAGEEPESVAVDKRQEILDHLQGAVASFRHSLELQPGDTRPRRDIELVRQWVRYYSERWREHDRRKRREELNPVAFLEFLIEVQTALRASVDALPATAPADAYAELKRVQIELAEEIPPLRDKIMADLQPAPVVGGAVGAAPDDELRQGIAMLQAWADAAGERMTSAAEALGARQAAPAAEQQQFAIDELEKIWEAVIPFHPLLARDLADQTRITASLEPAKPRDEAPPDDSEPENDDERDPTAANERAEKPASTGAAHATLAPEGQDSVKIIESQERTLRRTQLLRLKAEGELERFEKTPQAAAGSDEPGSSSQEHAADAGESDGQSPAVDPEQIKVGYRKAIELAPQAAEQMQAAVKALQQKDRIAAFPPAEEARRILEEIQKGQPRNDESKKQDDQDQPKKDQDQQQDSNEQDQKQDEKDDEKQDDPKENQDQDDEKKQVDERKPSPDRKQPQPQVSQDRIEEALRKVRERQQEKRERDRKLKARILGRFPVEKDW